MASGPEHFKAAEQLIKKSAEWAAEWPDAPARRLGDLAEAQVHATLALAAATAMNQGAKGAAAGADR